MEVNEFSMAYMWRSEDNLQESALYPSTGNMWVPGRGQVIRLGNRTFTHETILSAYKQNI